MQPTDRTFDPCTERSLRKNSFFFQLSYYLFQTTHQMLSTYICFLSSYYYAQAVNSYSQCYNSWVIDFAETKTSAAVFFNYSYRYSGSWSGSRDRGRDRGRERESGSTDWARAIEREWLVPTLAIVEEFTNHSWIPYSVVSDVSGLSYYWVTTELILNI